MLRGTHVDFCYTTTIKKTDTTTWIVSWSSVLKLGLAWCTDWLHGVLLDGNCLGPNGVRYLVRIRANTSDIFQYSIYERREWIKFPIIPREGCVWSLVPSVCSKITETSEVVQEGKGMQLAPLWSVHPLLQLQPRYPQYHNPNCIQLLSSKPCAWESLELGAFIPIQKANTNKDLDDLLTVECHSRKSLLLIYVSLLEHGMYLRKMMNGVWQYTYKGQVLVVYPTCASVGTHKHVTEERKDAAHLRRGLSRSELNERNPCFRNVKAFLRSITKAQQFNDWYR